LSPCLYGDITAAQDVYYTAPDVCIPNGPNFNLLFYTAWTKTIAYCISLLMMLGFMKWGIHMKYRSVIMFGIILKISTSLTDVIIAKRWNLMVSISDESFYFFGDGMLNIPASTWTQIAIVMATLSPQSAHAMKGKEVFTLAIVNGMKFMGNSASRIYGMFLIDMFGLTANMATGNCNFDNYPALSIAAHVVSPIFLFPIAYMLLPSQ
jgi:hypothetical protein